MKRLRKLWWVIPVLVVVLIGAGLLWAGTPLGPTEEALQTLESDDVVAENQNSWYVFAPESKTATTGVILYPGGRIDPRSYAPLAHEIAAEGYLVIIPSMPLNLAVLGISEASVIMDTFPSISSWVIGGHSLGGAMAARYALENQDHVDGLVLLAAYPASSDDLSASTLEALSISATEDGLASQAEIEASKSQLPQDTDWLIIEGGNHAQFGSYGIQNGDGGARIDETEQRDLIISGILKLLSKVE